MECNGPSTENLLPQLNLWQWLGVVLSPFLLTVLVLTIVFTATGGTSPIPQLSTGIYSLLSVFVVILLLRRLSVTTQTELFPIRPLTRFEMAVTVAAVLVTILVFDPVATLVTNVFGSGNGTADSFDSSLGAAIFIISSVVIAPVVEEFRFRGVALNTLRSRYSMAVAIVGSSILFGGIHLLSGGLSGVTSATLSGLVYAGMRIELENLSGVIIAHALNNLYWVLVIAGIVPNVVPG